GKFGGPGNYNSDNLYLYATRVIAPSTVASEFITDQGGGRTSGVGVQGFTIVDGCEFVGVSQGVWGGRVVRNSTIRDCCDSFSSSNHENGARFLGGSVDFYNNKVYNVREGVGFYLNPGWGGRS